MRLFLSAIGFLIVAWLTAQHMVDHATPPSTCSIPWDDPAWDYECGPDGSDFEG